MARTSKTVNLVPPLFRYNALNLLMFGYVQGVRKTIHTMTIDAALESFIDAYGLDPDDYNTESAKATYNDMKNHVADLQRDNLGSI